ncbi:ABC transporter substrate-binding protein [Sediminispirochaeta smaragdinae]|uniref:Extracellular solute-binding protein family 1 n=1 Tax=Sediminispirochaeta smaragdinae (strain DSM 11293 / JCM 15392 / SEBR 4228) TaxID=573413 RepID=E1R357_SEDSS|nr:extracellular solute-binding protein [Sediminispirochaeta smaragdinae]ADK81243.1 extracellular solute-binding protein family 1 [Sediminispirochaeta smaragdinae DSM 11293]
MKKREIVRLFVLCSFCVTTALLVGCNKKGEEATTQESDTITLSAYHYLDQTDKTTAPNFQALVEAFNKEYPNIKINFEFGYGEAYHTKLQTLAASGQLPDMMVVYPGKRTAYITSEGHVQDLRPWFSGHESEFASIALKPQGPNGEMWEIPEDISVTSIMYTNNKLLKELGLAFPKTLDELIAQGETIRKAGLIPISMANKDAWPMQSCLASMLAERTGGMEWFDKAVKGDGAGFDDDVFVHALEIINLLHEKEMFSPGINQLAYMQGLDDFVNERAVYFIDGGWMVNNMVGELSDEQKEYMSLESFPDIPNQKGESGSASGVAGTGFGMNSDLSGEKAEAAWKWIWFYSGPEGSAIRQRFGRLPAYTLKAPDDVDPMIKKLINYVGSIPMGYVLDSVVGAEGIGIFNNDLQEMMFGLTTPKDVASKLEEWVKENDRSN